MRCLPFLWHYFWNLLAISEWKLFQSKYFSRNNSTMYTLKAVGVETIFTQKWPVNFTNNYKETNNKTELLFRSRKREMYFPVYSNNLYCIYNYEISFLECKFDTQTQVWTKERKWALLWFDDMRWDFPFAILVNRLKHVFFQTQKLPHHFPFRIHKYSSLVLLLISSKASDWFTETSLSHAAGHNNQMSVSHRWTLPRCTPTRFCCCETPSNNTFAHGSVWYI